jgi:hypothetical protein
MFLWVLLAAAFHHAKGGLSGADNLRLHGGKVEGIRVIDDIVISQDKGN